MRRSFLQAQYLLRKDRPLISGSAVDRHRLLAGILTIACVSVGSVAWGGGLSSSDPVTSGDGMLYYTIPGDPPTVECVPDGTRQGF